MRSAYTPSEHPRSEIAKMKVSGAGSWHAQIPARAKIPAPVEVAARANFHFRNFNVRHISASAQIPVRAYFRFHDFNANHISASAQIPASAKIEAAPCYNVKSGVVCG